MHDTGLILTLAAALAAALGFGFLALRLRLPPIVGYIAAGLFVGPHTPGFTADPEIAQQLAEVGVILLMFGVGLHFHVKDLLDVRKVALTGAMLEIAILTTVGSLTARALGFAWPGALLFGVSLSVASTVVLTRVLAEHRELHTHAGRIAVGWLIGEDIFTVFVLVVMPALFGPDAARGQLGMAIGLAAVKLAAFTAIILGVGNRIIPRILSSVAVTQSRELFTLTVLVIALGISVAATAGFGVSMALGAFLAGMVVGQSEFSYRAASEALPMRDAFAVLFFVSVGMLFNPEQLFRDPVQVAVTTLIVLLVKPAVAFLIILLVGAGGRISVRVALSLAQIGEFSFILVTLGNELGILPPGASDSIIAAAIISITLNPLIYKLTPNCERAISRWKWMNPRTDLPDAVAEDADVPKAIIVGYGPVGQNVYALLSDQGVKPTVLELNIDTVRRLNQQGIRALYGDATQPDILRQAGIDDALALVLTPPAPPETADLIREARKMNPNIQVLVRSAYLSQVPTMRQAGADVIFSGEAEVSMAMTEWIMKRRGATPDELDVERRRIRRTLYGLPPKKATHAANGPL